MEEQNQIALMSAIMMTVTSAGMLSLVTPDTQGVPNFPSKKLNYNFVILNFYTLATLANLIGTISAVFLRMAIEEVGDVENVPVLLEWLGGLGKRFPILNVRQLLSSPLSISPHQVCVIGLCRIFHHLYRLLFLAFLGL